MAKKKTPFAESKDGKLFVKANSFMTPLVALVDGLTIAYSKVLGVLKSAKEQHEAGVMEYSS